MMLGKLLLWLVFLSVLLAGVFVWKNSELPCRQPIEYSIGQLDASFGISREAFLRDIVQAEAVWETVWGRNLFQYVPEAPLVVNLIYDDRQQQTVEGQALDQTRKKAESIQEKLSTEQERVMTTYEKRSTEYEKALSTFKSRLAEYNKSVTDWNKKGGASPEEYNRLQSEMKSLSALQGDLESRRVLVNTLAEQVNKFSKQQIEVVEKYNDQVKEYSNRYGEGGESFDQGEYTDSAINIYQFDDEPHLRLVLAHELGHALGIGHIDNPASIMYYFMERQDSVGLVPTAEDKAALTAVCSQSVWGGVVAKLQILFER